MSEDAEGDEQQRQPSDPATVTPPAPAPAPAPAPERTAPASTTPRLLLAALGGAAVALLVVAVVVLATRGGGTEDGRLPDDLGDVAAVAGEVAEAILTYDHRDMDATLTRVEEHLSGEFLDVYAETFELVQVPLIQQLQAVAVATVKDVFVTAIDGDSARAIVELDYRVESNAQVRTVNDVYLRFELNRVDGVWVVQEIPARIGGDETVLPSPGATTTSTPPTTAAP